MGPEPDVGQQLRQPVGRSGWKPPMHIRQVTDGGDAVPLATGCHAEEHCGSAAAGVAAGRYA
jgi:hypothetical protein